MTQEFDHISLTNHETHAVVRLEEPERLNALTFKMIGEIMQAFTIAEKNDKVRSIVLRGAGRSFCAGDNLKGLGPVDLPDDLLLRLKTTGYFAAIKQMRDTRKPIIVAAQGHALGAGLEFLMAGDIKIATEDAKLGIPFVKLGLTGGTFHLPRAVGVTRAAAMLFSGEPISGAEGLKYNLVTETVPTADDLDAAIDKWIDTFSKVSTQAIGLMKRTLYRAHELSADTALETMTLSFMTAIHSEEFQQRRQAWKDRPRNEKKDKD